MQPWAADAVQAAARHAEQGRPHRTLHSRRRAAVDGGAVSLQDPDDAPDIVVVLYEAVHAYRQIFTDGRALPKDPNPNWMGYSVGRWEGDTFVVESPASTTTSGWTTTGHPAGESLRVTERFRRKDFGHMDVEITIDDPKTYTKPWNVTLPLVLPARYEMLEYICPGERKGLRAWSASNARNGTPNVRRLTSGLRLCSWPRA